MAPRSSDAEGFGGQEREPHDFDESRLGVTRNDGPKGIFVSTANSAKFPEVLREEGIDVEIPGYMKGALEKESYAIKMSNRYADFKEFMLSEAENVIRRQKEKS